LYFSCVNFAPQNILVKKQAIQIIAISGSLRPGSANADILRIVGGMAGSNVVYTIYEGIGELPHFNPALDNDDSAETFNQFRTAINNADGVIICTPEYAFGVPGVLKNALDWTVFSGSFDKKPVAVITASSLGDKAHASLLLTFKALGANIPDGGTVLIPYVRTKVNNRGEITDPALLQTLNQLLNALVQLIKEGKELHA